MTDVPARCEWRDVAGIRVATVYHVKPQREILLFLGMLACVDPVEMRRSSILAEEWSANVTVVDLPGCGRGDSRLTKEDRSSLRRGDFASLSRRMVRSAQEVNPQLRRPDVVLVGYSLGASLAAAAAADAGLLHVGQLTIVEPVAVERRNPFRLLRSVHLEDRATAWPDEHSAPGHGFTPSRTDLALLGYALSRGHLTADIVRAKGVQRFAVQLVHGRESQLCSQRAVDRAVRVWRHSGIEARDLPLPGRHGLWHSPTAVADLARLSAACWPDHCTWLPQ